MDPDPDFQDGNKNLFFPKFFRLLLLKVHLLLFSKKKKHKEVTKQKEIKVFLPIFA
jgi:hypothetical protein